MKSNLKRNVNKVTRYSWRDKQRHSCFCYIVVLIDSVLVVDVVVQYRFVTNVIWSHHVYHIKDKDGSRSTLILSPSLEMTDIVDTI